MDKIQVQEYLTQGAVMSGQGKYEEALMYYDRAEKENPMEIDVYLSKGIALANLERLDDAKTQFEKALKLDRTAGIAYFHLGNIAVLKGNIALGFENYNKAAASGYDDAQLYYSMGLLHEENGEVDMAIRNYSKAIQRDALRPDIRIRKARLLLEGNHIPEALQTLDETILTNPDVFEGYHLKFTILVQLKQYAKAEALLRDAMALFPKDPAFVLDQVTLLVEQQKTDEALAILSDLEDSGEADESLHRKIYMEKAQIYASKDEITSAIDCLEQAKALAEKNSEFDAEVIFLLANCHLSTGEYEKVLSYSRELAQRAEAGYIKETARYYIPLALKLSGRENEALPLYKEAINEYRNQALAAPGNMDAYLLRIMCLRDIGEYEKALELIDYVVALQPDRAEPRMLKAAILEAMGRTEDAEAETKAVNAMLPKELRKE